MKKLLLLLMFVLVVSSVTAKEWDGFITGNVVYGTGLNEIEFEGNEFTFHSNPLIEIYPRGDDELRIRTTNVQGNTYDFPYVEVSSSGVFRFGEDNTEKLHFKESHSTGDDPNCFEGDFVIGIDDKFLLWYNEGDYSHVQEFESINIEEKVINFTDYAVGHKQYTYEILDNCGGTGVGELIYGGNVYKFWVGPGTGELIAIDLNGDGKLDGSETKFATKSGHIIDLGEYSDPIVGTNILEISDTDVKLQVSAYQGKVNLALDGFEEVKCTDSDGGKNYYVKGYVDEPNRGKTYDSCGANGLLYETLCTENPDAFSPPEYLESYAYDCEHGCEDGVCVEKRKPYVPEPEFCDVIDYDFDAPEGCKYVHVGYYYDDKDCKHPEYKLECEETPKKCPEYQCEDLPDNCKSFYNSDTDENGCLLHPCGEIVCHEGEDILPDRVPKLPQTPKCNGCEVGDNCYDTGIRKDNGYCDIDGDFKRQKAEGESCDNDFECSTNECSSGECVDIQAELREQRGLIQSILDFLKKLNPFNREKQEEKETEPRETYTTDSSGQVIVQRVSYDEYSNAHYDKRDTFSNLCNVQLVKAYHEDYGSGVALVTMLSLQEKKLLEGLTDVTLTVNLDHPYYDPTLIKSKRTIEAGTPGSAVKIIQYCSPAGFFCKTYHEKILPNFMEDYVKAGEATYEYKHFFFEGDVQSEQAAIAAECVREEDENAFLSYVDFITRYQDDWKEDENLLSEFASEFGISPSVVRNCQSRDEQLSRVLEEVQEARDQGILSFPTTTINGEIIAGVKPYQHYVEVIES